MRKVRKISSPSQARKPRNKPNTWSESANALNAALELTRLDTLQTKRSRPVGTSSPVYPHLSNQIIPPAGVVSPPIEKPEQEEYITLSLEDVQRSGRIQDGPTTFVSTLYISLVLGSLHHSWWVLGVSLLIGLTLTGIMILSAKRVTFQTLMALLLWLLFGLTWGYIGWLVCDSYLPLIIHGLCAIIGFVLGMFGHFIISGITNSTEFKSTRVAKRCAFAAFVDSVCISLVFGYLLHSWWALGASLLVGLILAGIIILLAKGNTDALNQTSIDIVWLLFALMWGYAGWFVCDVHIPSIVHFLCALVGFVLGFVGYALTYVFLSPAGVEEKAIRESE